MSDKQVTSEAPDEPVTTEKVPEAEITAVIQPRNYNVQYPNVTIRKDKKGQKRPREKREFTVITNERETVDFIRDCRTGKVSPKLHIWDKDSYIASHPQRVALDWLKRDKSALFEVEFQKNGQNTGKMTGKLTGLGLTGLGLTGFDITARTVFSDLKLFFRISFLQRLL